MSEQRESLLRLLGLKKVARRGWTRHAIPEAAVESVADHSYGTALLAWLLCPCGLDLTRVMEMALVHDLAEIVTGDLTPSDGVPEQVKQRDEARALADLLAGARPGARGLGLLDEYQAQTTPEARFVKAMDRLDMALQSRIYERDFQLNLAEFRESAAPILRQAGYFKLLDT